MQKFCLSLLLLLGAGLAHAQAVINGASPTDMPNQVSVTTAWLYLNKMHYAGAWSSSATYNSQDVVSYGGGSYVSLETGNTNSTPTSSPLAWAPVVSTGPGLASICKPTSGNANAYVCAATPAVGTCSAANPPILLFIPDVNGSGGATTVNPGCGVQSIKQADGATNPSSTAFVAGVAQLLAYDGSLFRILSAPASGGGALNWHSLTSTTWSTITSTIWSQLTS